MTTPEDEEFIEADSILKHAPIPHLQIDSDLDLIKGLLKTDNDDNTCIFFHGELLSTIEQINIPLTPLSLYIQSYGISSFDMGSGRGVWDGSIIFGSWLCRNMVSGENGRSMFPFEESVRVVELGSGCSGVPGICVAKMYPNASVVLSDAQSTLIQGLRQNIRLNDCDDRVSAQIINWNEHESPDFGVKWSDSSTPVIGDEIAKADILIGAELLWAGCDPHPLLLTISKLLNHDGGTAYVLMPKGGRGIEASFFEALSSLNFHCETVILGTLAAWEGSSFPRLESREAEKDDCSAGEEVFQVHILSLK
jgi:hypothetical protein